jgi:hypothetical protein
MHVFREAAKTWMAGHDEPLGKCSIFPLFQEKVLIECGASLVNMG